jgi:hypothetical protein
VFGITATVLCDGQPDHPLDPPRHGTARLARHRRRIARRTRSIRE